MSRSEHFAHFISALEESDEIKGVNKQVLELLDD